MRATAGRPRDTGNDVLEKARLKENNTISFLLFYQLYLYSLWLKLVGNSVNTAFKLLTIYLQAKLSKTLYVSRAPLDSHLHLCSVMISHQSLPSVSISENNWPPSVADATNK